MRIQQLSFLAVLVTACEAGDLLPPPPSAPALQFSMVEGDQQEGVPGETLAVPFTVKVTGATGVAAGVQVTWTLRSGAGSFLSPTTTLTDSHGLATMRFTPATHRVAVSAAINASLPSLIFQTLPRPLGVYSRVQGPSGCDINTGCERYLLYPDSTFALQYPRARYEGTYVRRDSVLTLAFAQGSWAAAGTIRGDSLIVRYNANASLSDFEDGTFLLEKPRISVVSGADQEGVAGKLLDHELAVRVADPRGRGLGHQLVTWRVTSGAAELWPATGQTSTDSDGRTSLSIRPLIVGTIRVAAELAEGNQTPATFQATSRCWAESVTIVFWRERGGMDDAFYLGTVAGPIRVLAGTTVVLLNTNTVSDFKARFTSTAIPPGGTAFDSGLLDYGESYRFVPNVEGTWNFKDQVSGVPGTLIAGAGVPEEWRCR